MKRNDLKIEFRAVPYTHEEKVLEYRISPNQDLTYYIEVSYLWGLIKFKKKKQYDIRWYQVHEFHCGLTSHYYEADNYFNYMPIWCNKQETLNWYKRTFNTIGAFERYITDREAKQLEKYRIRRAKYLEDRKKILY